MLRIASFVVLLLGLSTAVAGAVEGPPPATVTAGTRTLTLSEGSYCWGTQCVDKIPPANRTDIVRLRVTKGAVLRLKLGFAATSWNARVLGGAPRSFAPGKVATWRATRSGTLEVEARGARGSASYLVRLVLR